MPWQIWAMQHHYCSQRPARLRLGGTDDRPFRRARAEGSGGPDNSRLRKIDLAGNGVVRQAPAPPDLSHITARFRWRKTVPGANARACRTIGVPMTGRHRELPPSSPIPDCAG